MSSLMSALASSLHHLQTDTHTVTHATDRYNGLVNVADKISTRDAQNSNINCVVIL